MHSLPTLFNIFLERIMPDALEEHNGTGSLGGRTIINMQFADDIDSLYEKGQKIKALVESFDTFCLRY